jgi:hypothetical protein
MKRRQVFRAQASKSQSTSSVRRFTNSGPVLPFNPSSIPGCQLWLDGADSSSVALNSSSNVLAWIDKSGNSRDLGVGSGTTSYSSNAIVLNSSYMFVNSPVNLTNVTVFIVSKSTGVTNQTILGAKPNTDYVYNSVDGFGFYKDPPTGRIRFYGQGNDSMQSIFFTDTSTPKLYSFQSTGTTVSGWLNGTSQSGGTLTISRGPTAQGFAIGAEWGGTSYVNIWVTASIYEILVYNTALSTIQRQKVEGYLANKWGLQTSLPSNHPHKTAAPTYEEPVFVPTLISGNQLWLDGNDPLGTGTQPANGAIVSTWVDKSGNGLNGTSTGTTPLFASGGGITFSAGAYNTSYSSSLTNESLFVVSRYTRTSGTLSLVGQTGDGARLLSLGAGASTAQLQSSVYNVALGALSSSTTVPINTIGLGGLITTNSTMDIFYNGTSVGTPTAVTITSGRTSIIGGASTGGSINTSQYFGGIIHEVIGFTGQLTTSQRRRVEGYLAQKWGSQSSLPANHPFKTIAPTGIPRSITIQSLSALFNNSSISVPSNSAVTLGTNNHTIEFWAYQTSRGQYDCPFSYSANSTSTNTYYMAIGGYLAVLVGNPGGGWAVNMGVTVSPLPSLNAWHHYAIVRNGTTFTLYINGISRETATSSVSIGAQVGPFMIGDVSSTTNTPLFGYITNFRVVNGTAVYTSNFTPPTSPLTAIPNTQVLLQGLVDRSPNAFTVTSTGSVTLSTSVSPFV